MAMTNMNTPNADVDQLECVTGPLRETLESLLYREARLLDRNGQRAWLETIVDKDINYQVLVRELRSTRDKNVAGPDFVNVYDDDYKMLDARVRQTETEMLWRANPPERFRRFVTNIEVYRDGASGRLHVYSNCMVVRNRRIYEQATFVYGREDTFRAGDDGSYRLLKRLVDYDQRFVEGKNLLFFL